MSMWSLWWIWDNSKKPEADVDSEEELMAIKSKVVEKVLVIEIYVKRTFQSIELITALMICLQILLTTVSHS